MPGPEPPERSSLPEPVHQELRQRQQVLPEPELPEMPALLESEL